MKPKLSLIRKVEKLLGIKQGSRTGNISIRCPFHNDTSPSASINFEKGLLNCFYCDKGWNFNQIVEELGNVETGDTEFEMGSRERRLESKNNSNSGVLSKRHARVSSSSDSISKPDDSWNHLAVEEYLKSRGITEFPIDCFIDKNKKLPNDKLNPFYNYLCFVSSDGSQVVGRNVGSVTKSRPRYRNERGAKNLFYIHQDNSSLLWLVEGVIDGLSLYQLGYRNIASTNSTSGWAEKQTDNIAYSLRNKTVVILFDADASGFKGARKIAEKFNEFEVDHAILELPTRLGNDINDALQRKKKGLQKWLEATYQRLNPDEVKFTKAFFDGKLKSLQLIPTGILEVDEALHGGFRDGGHVISGETSTGKTSTVLAICVHNVELAGKTVLYNSCEISKMQMWARIASRNDKHVWRELEQNPQLASKDTREYCKDVAQYLKIVNGWPIQRMLKEANNYDIMVVDYLQRAPSVYDGSESAEKHNLDKMISRLSDIARDMGKIIIIVSSLSRYGYDRPDVMNFKGTNSFEYVGATLAKLILIKGMRVYWNLLKDTRGGTLGKYMFHPDLGHCLLEEGD